jgi:hypothetical protein
MPAISLATMRWIGASFVTRSTVHVVALAALGCIWAWNLDTGLRVHSIAVELANGSVYEVDVHRVYSDGWRRQVHAVRMERELLDGAPLEWVRARRVAGRSASWLTHAEVWLYNAYNTSVWWMTDTFADAQASFSDWRAEREMRSHEENHETFAIDIRRNGKVLPIAGVVGDAIFISVKEVELLYAQIPGAAVSHGLYDLNDWFYAEYTDGLEMVIIGKYMLHVVDGRVVRVVGGRGRFDGVGRGR